MSTLHTGARTHRRVLPQPAALESVPADNPGVGTKRGTDIPRTAQAGRRDTGVQHGRGETTGGAPVPGGVAAVPAGRKPSSTKQHSATQQNRTTRITSSPKQSRFTADNAVVFVLDRHKRPLMPTDCKRAKKLLARGRAVVHRKVPFTIRLKDRTVDQSMLEPLGLGIDPGSQHTGLSLDKTVEAVDESTGEVTTTRTGLWLGQLDHRGQHIHLRLVARAQRRRGRRGRNLRHRAARNRNRSVRVGWLPPSVQHRVDSTMTCVTRLQSLAPIASLRLERVSFDTHAMTAPGISGLEYQQGTLAGTEIREYLLAKFCHRCVYCDATGVGTGSVPLNIDHLLPRARGGTNRVSNLVLACVRCNQAKGARSVDAFVTDGVRRARIKAEAKTPLRDAAAMNACRNRLAAELDATGLPVEWASGGRTKWNRVRNGVPKDHSLDALCVGAVDVIVRWVPTVLHIQCVGRGRYQRVTTDRFGFPRSHRPRRKQHYGFITGDLVKAVIPTGPKAGVYRGRVIVRSTRTFRLVTPTHRYDGINCRYMTTMQRGDGYSYKARPSLQRRLAPHGDQTKAA
ncbi:HNH endonuclease [Branchiibius hedensis]|uniref:HNH endonuclease n=1 Tax=Branchiibius hedensis TaxID=672460 RepID=A0A2Y9BTQ5_9MICO|nr:RNA-guided endonuclease IscB [Branchiibius hedensis]PWJ25599.1 HNH endonuclease [Branchiibius hedensis]SSA34412.1 HNH endonuclease [Branchiibius hedensis]